MTDNKLTSNQIVGNYSKSQLIDLLKELKNIGDADKPALIKQSETMKTLFESEVTLYNHWYDRYSNVRRSIETEILFRIRTDKF